MRSKKRESESIVLLGSFVFVFFPGFYKYQTIFTESLAESPRF